jgi:hypothetical protein
MSGPRRHCGACIHFNVDKGTCHHPQAEHGWGFLKGLDAFHIRSYRRWPQAPGWCGFFNPNEGWLLAFECLQPKRRRQNVSV